MTLCEIEKLRIEQKELDEVSGRFQEYSFNRLKKLEEERERRNEQLNFQSIIGADLRWESTYDVDEFKVKYEYSKR